MKPSFAAYYMLMALAVRQRANCKKGEEVGTLIETGSWAASL